LHLPTPAKREVLRLDYLDGLRALAAVYVVLFHAGVCFPVGELSFVFKNLRRAFSFGHDAVAVFIVLSGYCLMIPAARRDGHVAHGVRAYFSRRAWRILPPYYATLAASLLFIAAFPSFSAHSDTIWDDTYPAFTLGSIGSHLLLVHNWFPAWVNTINGPLWSVATEWQIYFFFPFVLLPVWRRFGALATVCAGFAIGALPIGFVPTAASKSASWYLGLFACGMVAAAVGFSARPADLRLRERVPWLWVFVGLLVCCLLGVSVFISRWFVYAPLSDALVGATTASALVYLTARARSDAPRPLVLRVLESRPLVTLGHFSYSLYLTHLPVVAACYFALERLHLSPDQRMAALIGSSLPLACVVSYGFFLTVERHFLERRSS